ncbi:charged multivesicular body protein 7 [Anopheles bellator]|uniref:charged multivesicular body protein 7 n=1 Tax=Anopheles bellator TaxID=139047 RepID=UPI0026496BAB|nr:charged multivesicular body protein 7 [Anopheles bellator]
MRININVFEFVESRMAKPTHEELSVLKQESDKSFLPECWRDDNRMGVLLSEFRPRMVNPDSYDSKLKFWKELISSYCIATGQCVVSIASLKESFRRKGTVPYCLQTVFDEMDANGELLQMEQLLEQTASLGWSQWAFNKFMQTPVKWGYEKARHTLVGNTRNELQQYVVKKVAMHHAEQIEQIINKQGLCNKILSYDELVQIVNQSSNVVEGGIRPVVALLEREKRLTKEILLEETHKREIVKFAKPNSIAQPISHLERSIFELEQSEKELKTSIASIDQQIAETMGEVHACIKNGCKQLAKSNLKKKHILEQNMQRKVSALENLQHILSKIHDSQLEKNIIEAYKLGTKTLKQAFADSGLTLDSVDNTLLELKDVLETHDEMQNMIGAGTTEDVDDLDLEQELSGLIDMSVKETNNEDKHKIHIASTVQPAQMRELDQLLDFDKEIEKRLAALRVDSTLPQRPGPKTAHPQI